MRHTTSLIAVGVTLVLAVSCVPTAPSGTTQEATAPFVVTTATRDALLEMFTDQDTRRWTQPVRFAVVGTVTAEDLAVLREGMATFAGLTGLQLSLVDGESEVTVRFEPRVGWPGGSEHAAGLTHIRWRGDVIESGTIYIDPDIAQVARNSTIVHEIGHALGLEHVSCVTSIMVARTEHAPIWRLAELDRSVVRALYHPDFPIGSSGDDLGRRLQSDSPGPGCDRPEWEWFSSQGADMYCRLEVDPAPCHDPRAVVAGIPGTPLGWMSGGTFHPGSEPPAGG